MANTISSFKGKYYFLSNFFSAPVEYQGYYFDNNEAAFQAAKCPKRMQEFCGLNPSLAKRLGHRVALRSDWEEVKYNIMHQICLSKFSQNPALRKRLIDTGDAELVEGNTWGDRIWGVCDGVGENNLGKILMRVRDELGGFGD
ncbi:NADAR family protein [Bacteroides acidifaciens]|uniref:NADAR family protein n=1 Tax=Bacteroides acidifaciens TaxID=85831 RepID=UPI00248C4A01|nr:NADAR family protein [Bacteroides acidifaciens]